MKLLLDTHAFLWFIAGSPQMSQTARLLIEDMENQRFLSIVSLWEIAIKTNLGKLDVLPAHQSFEGFFRDQMWDNCIDLLPINTAHLELLTTMPHHHRDPFDRLLIAQAQTENLALVSTDSALDAYEIERRW